MVVAGTVGVLTGVKVSWGVEAEFAATASVGPAVSLERGLADGNEVKVATGVEGEADGETTRLADGDTRVRDMTGVPTVIAMMTGVGVLVAIKAGLGVLVGVGVGRERTTALYPTTSSSRMTSPAIAEMEKTHPINKMPLRKPIGNLNVRRIMIFCTAQQSGVQQPPLLQGEGRLLSITFRVVDSS